MCTIIDQITLLCTSLHIFALGIKSPLHLVQVRNEKARRYLTSMRKKQPVPLSQKFPNADPLALRLLARLLAFDPKDRPTAEEVNRFFTITCYLEAVWIIQEAVL